LSTMFLDEAAGTVRGTAFTTAFCRTVAAQAESSKADARMIAAATIFFTYWSLQGHGRHRESARVGGAARARAGDGG
jgi:hypothetical protein